MAYSDLCGCCDGKSPCSRDNDHNKSIMFGCSWRSCMDWVGGNL